MKRPSLVLGLALLLVGCAAPTAWELDREQAEGGDVEAMRRLARQLDGHPQINGCVGWGGASMPSCPGAEATAEATRWLRRAADLGSDVARAELVGWLLRDASWRSFDRPYVAGALREQDQAPEAAACVDLLLAHGRADLVLATTWAARPSDRLAWIRRAARSGDAHARRSLDGWLVAEPALREVADEELLPVELGGPVEATAELTLKLPGLLPEAPALHDALRAARSAPSDDPAAWLAVAARDLVRARGGPRLDRAAAARAARLCGQVVARRPDEPRAWALLALAEATLALDPGAPAGSAAEPRLAAAGEALDRAFPGRASGRCRRCEGATGPGAGCCQALAHAALLDPTLPLAPLQARLADAGHGSVDGRRSLARQLARTASGEGALDRVLALDPDDGDARRRRAWLLRRRGALAEALADLELAGPASLHVPAPFAPPGERVLVLARLGELERAEALLTEPSTLRGVVRLLAGRRGDAIEDLERAAPTDPSACALLGLLGADPARHWRGLLIDAAAASPWVRPAEGARFALGLESTADCEARAVALPPDEGDRKVRRLALLGLAAEERGDLDEARRLFERCDAAAREASATIGAEDADALPERLLAEGRLRALR